jgi:hypothetical protein
MTREECPTWAMEAGAMEEHWGLWSERGINI